MNQRNAECILDHNPRSLFPVVDDKLHMRDLCLRIGVPTPDIYGVFTFHSELRHLKETLEALDELVIKPCNGSSGRGVMVLTRCGAVEFACHNRDIVPLNAIRQHISDILSGLYSLGGRPDRVVLQERVRLHPAFARISYGGIPDVRVVLYRCEPAMVMLRLPTLASAGRANLHQGGIGAGVELALGRTYHAVQYNRCIQRHPDTGESLVDREVPCWDEVLAMSRKVARAVGLGYVGVDIVVDECKGPMLLEANARPGLAIQIANESGLIPHLRAIDARLAAQKTHAPNRTLPGGNICTRNRAGCNSI